MGLFENFEITYPSFFAFLHLDAKRIASFVFVYQQQAFPVYRIYWTLLKKGIFVLRGQD